MEAAKSTWLENYFFVFSCPLTPVIFDFARSRKLCAPVNEHQKIYIIEYPQRHAIIFCQAWRSTQLFIWSMQDAARQARLASQWLIKINPYFGRQQYCCAGIGAFTVTYLAVLLNDKWTRDLLDLDPTI